jgi:hypothetical protein
MVENRSVVVSHKNAAAEEEAEVGPAPNIGPAPWASSIREAEKGAEEGKDSVSPANAANAAACA